MKRIILMLTVAAMMVVALTITAPMAFAKIQPVPTSCTNQGGQQPGGQQPQCKGGGLDQQSENQNPSGQAPPGQNK